MKHSLASAAVLAQRFLHPGDAVLEIGAAEGAYTRIYAERVGPAGTVLAVEPDHRNQRRFQQSMADLPWVQLWPGAVSDATGEASFVPAEHPHRGSLYAANVPWPGEQYAVTTTTIDTLLRQMPTPQVIHIDAQGAEMAILQGAKRALDLPIVWVIELWATGLRQAGAHAVSVVAAFRRRQYQVHDPRGMPVAWSRVDSLCQQRPGRPHFSCDVLMVPAALCQVAA